MLNCDYFLLSQRFALFDNFKVDRLARYGVFAVNQEVFDDDLDGIIARSHLRF